MKILGILFALAGISCFVWYKRLVLTISKAYSREFQKKFGDVRDWESSRYQLVYKAVIVVAGVIFLIIAFGMMFGPIYQGSANPANVGL
jgi:hypothetical protein